MYSVKEEMKEYDRKRDKLSELIDNRIEDGDPVRDIADLCMDVTGHWGKKRGGINGRRQAKSSRKNLEFINLALGWLVPFWN